MHTYIPKVALIIFSLSSNTFFSQTTYNHMITNSYKTKNKVPYVFIEDEIEEEITPYTNLLRKQRKKRKI
ncbi:MAG: hypothetical protein CL947_01650 [Epsilonproteobacteria bacterium]|nr:hypothetical protein [Campylobacterota bacterium]|tara:strand:+ start:1384 stop:1593 length:210 start_codon:yes stop_codon:yes gene_type:complete